MPRVVGLGASRTGFAVGVRDWVPSVEGIVRRWMAINSGLRRLMNNRDDFSEKTKLAVALRASYRCSFEGCNRSTVGPSDESNASLDNIGKAAHISAAAPEGRR